MNAFELAFPTPSLPMVLFQRMEPRPTLALKSPSKIRFSSPGNCGYDVIELGVELILDILLLGINCWSVGDNTSEVRANAASASIYSR